MQSSMGNHTSIVQLRRLSKFYRVQLQLFCTFDRFALRHQIAAFYLIPCSQCIRSYTYCPVLTDRPLLQAMTDH